MKKIVVAALAAVLGLAASTDVGFAACKVGDPHCVKNSGGKRPTHCGGPTSPCTIDGGLGSECSGGGANCGYQGQTLPGNNPPPTTHSGANHIRRPLGPANPSNAPGQ